jgi:iron only hydrogenase large subunit-like protein
MPKEKIKIKINGQEIIAARGQKILAIAAANDIFIPTLCADYDFPDKANCRVCVVEVKGLRRLVTACSTSAEDGMEIMTDSEKVKKARNTNIELLFAEHIEKCPTCVWRFECKLLDYAARYKILISTFKDRKNTRKIHKFANAVEIDGTQCIDCRNCIDACSLQQKINYLEIRGKGIEQEIVPASSKDKHCILCGQCTLHCPVSAAQEQLEYQEVEALLKNKSHFILVVQFTPSVSAAIGEDFGLPPGKIIDRNLSAGLRALGFDYVFSALSGRQIDILADARELLQHLRSGGTSPLLTATCPSWRRYVEKYRSDLLPFLSQAQSSQISNSRIIRTDWAEKKQIDCRNIKIVTVTSCTSQKFEAISRKNKIKGRPLVDFVLTTRELTFLFKKYKIALLERESALDILTKDLDASLCLADASGGTLDSVIKSAAVLSGQKKADFSFLNRKKAIDSIREAQFEIDGRILRTAVVNGIGSIRTLLDNFGKYDYVEVMACPDGCINGGGQPIPTNAFIRKKRLSALRRFAGNDGEQKK